MRPKFACLISRHVAKLRWRGGVLGAMIHASAWDGTQHSGMACMEGPAGPRTPSAMFSESFRFPTKIQKTTRYAFKLRPRKSNSQFLTIPFLGGGAVDSSTPKVGANRPIPSPSPAHIGPRALHRPGNIRDDGSQERGQGAGPKRSVHAVRREAVTAQIQAFGSLFCAAQTTPAAKFSVGGSTDAYAPTPPTLVGRPWGRHMAAAGTADGLGHAQTKNITWWCEPVRSTGHKD